MISGQRYDISAKVVCLQRKKVTESSNCPQQRGTRPEWESASICKRVRTTLLHHDLLAVLDDNTLVGFVHLLASEVEDSAEK